MSPVNFATLVFDRRAHCLARDALDTSESDQPIGQELEGPAATALRRIATGQLDQLLLDGVGELHFLRSRGLGPMVEGGPEALGHEPLADPGDGRGTNMRGPRQCPRRFASARPVPRRPRAERARGPACVRRPCRRRPGVPVPFRSSVVRVTLNLSIRGSPSHGQPKNSDAHREADPGLPVNRRLTAH